MTLFGERGYRGTTMRDIASAAGFLPGSLYAHIESKEELLLEIVELAFERFLRLADELEGSTDPPEKRLRHAIEQHIVAVAESRERTLVVLHQWRFLSGENYERIVGMRRRYERLFIETVRDGVERGAFGEQLNPRIAAYTVLGVLNWAPEWLGPEDERDVVEIGRRLADSLLLGLER